MAYKLGAWTVAETNLFARFAVMGHSSDPIGTNDRFGQLWVSNSADVVVKPYVEGTNFFVFDMTVGMGTQTLVAAIRDAAGNMGYATNTFTPTVVTNGGYQYNAAGCLTNRHYSGKDYTDQLGLTWNGQYQLTAAATNGALAETYGYDGLGRRIFIAQGGSTNWMVFDGNQVVAEVDGSGNLKKSYVYGPGIDNAISMTVYGTTTNTYYFLKDHLGSTLALTDTSGNIVESYRFDAWGRVLGIYNGAGNQIDESAVGNRILWQGREYSFISGLYYFRARWADPVTGRWLSPDPIGIAGGLNQYVLCENNSVNFSDPAGLQSVILTPYILFEQPSVIPRVSIPRVLPEGWRPSDNIPPEFRSPINPKANWTNPKTGEWLRNDMNHPKGKIDPHYDYGDGMGNQFRIFKDGARQLKELIDWLIPSSEPKCVLA